MLKLSTSASVFAIATAGSAIALSTPAQAAVTASCTVQPRPGQPNPLAIRATLRVEEQDGNTTFRYQSLPTPVDADQPPVTIEQERTLIFYKTNIAAARDRMLKNPKYFTELRGFSEAAGFKPVNDALVCRNQTTAKGAGASQLRSALISDLPDGSYRFWNGAPSSTVTDQQILAGALTFLFTKTGNRVVGYFARPDNTVMCITGTVAGNKISGVVNPAGAFAGGKPESFQNKPYDPKGFMMLGKWEDSGNRGSFSPSSLDLSTFSRINLGPRSAPSICR